MKRLALSLIASIALAAPAFAQGNLAQDVANARARYGPKPTPAELAEALNAIAWAHRAEGWGLSRKKGGNRCESPNLPALGPIACDILQHGPSDTLWDVFRDVEGADGLPAARATWGHADPHNDPVGRPFVAPVPPTSNSQPPTPNPDPQPGTPATPPDWVADLLAGLADAENLLRAELAAIRQELAESKAREYEVVVFGQRVTVRPKK